MKKLLIFMLILSFIVGLTACKAKNEYLNWENIPEYDWTNPKLQHDIDSVIPNMECAMDVAQVIFDNHFESSKDEYVILNAQYIDSYKMWVVSFGYPFEKGIMGGGIQIAMSKETGEVLSIWYSH